MNIFCLSDSFWPDDTTGVQKSILPEVEGLVKLGHHVTVACRRLHPTHPQYESRAGYDLYRYSSPSKGSKFYQLYPLFTLAALPRLIRYLHSQKRFDVAYVHNPVQAVALKPDMNIPYVYNYHASMASEIKLDTQKGKYGKLGFLAQFIIRWVKSGEIKALDRANQILVHSNFMREDITGLYRIDPAKIRCLQLCVDSNKFCFAESTPIARQKLSLPQNRPILLTVRRLVARVGLENLITAMPGVVEKFPDVLLLIGGAGYLKNALLEQIKSLHLENNIRLLGFIPEEILPTYYQAADLFVLPTLEYEGFGLVTLESLACGTPVIATPVGASPEILEPLGKEFLFEAKTPEAIIAGLTWWLARGFDAETRRRCRQFFAQNFSQERVCSELESILKLYAGA